MRIEHWRYAVPLWLRGLFRRRDVERDLDEEIRNHIEQQTAANVVAGMPPDEARRAALVTFGGVERIKDESRDARRLSIIDSVGQLRSAARSLWRARTFTVATITTIALAIANCMLNFASRPVCRRLLRRMVALRLLVETVMDSTSSGLTACAASRSSMPSIARCVQ